MPRRRLSERQKQRIRQIQERRRQRLIERSQRNLIEADDDEAREGLIVVRHGANLGVETRSGKTLHCLSRQNIGEPVCGDRVVWQPTGADSGVVTAVLERGALLSRPDYSGRPKPLAANITQLVVVVAPRPEPGDYLIDQYLVAAESIGVSALIAVNKIDTCPDQCASLKERLKIYADIGYPLIWISARQEQGLVPLVDRLRAQTSILVGQSGVGKSSLVKVLLPDLVIQIGRLSKATGLGRHTTSAATCYRLPQGGMLIDSPGVRSFRLGRIDYGTLERGYREFRRFLGQCRFGDCRHDREPGCAIKAALRAGQIHPRRLANFHHMARQLRPPAAST